MKIKLYLENVALAQAKVDINEGKCDYKSLYSAWKNQIVGELNKIEDQIVKLQGKVQGSASKFFDDFGNGSLNDDNKFIEELEQLVVTLISKKSSPSNNENFQRIKKYIDLEAQNIIESLKKLCGDISKEPFQVVLTQSETNSFENSVIVKPNECEMIGNWVKETVGSAKKFEPLFNGREHGFSSGEFHKKCDGKGPTIIFIETTTGKRLGGYANSSWNTLSKVITEENCFLFSLDWKEKYLHKPGSTNSMAGGRSYLLLFGNGNDLILYDNCNSNTNSSFVANSTYDCKSRTPNDIVGASQYFTVKSFEVYLVKQINFHF